MIEVFIFNFFMMNVSAVMSVSDLKVVGFLPFTSAHKLEVIFFASAILFIYFSYQTG